MDAKPSAFHLTQLALMKASMHRDEGFDRLCALHEVQMIELRELHQDPEAERQAQELIARCRGGD